MADALDTLARLRRFEADAARRALGDAVAAEHRARAAADGARGARAREAAFAAGDTADAMGRAYGAWLPASLQAIEAADSDCARHAAATQAARSMLAARKAALEAVETLTAERDRLRRRAQARRVQSRLDELGHRGPQSARDLSARD